MTILYIAPWVSLFHRTFELLIGVHLTGMLLRQREEWIRFSYSNEDTKDEKEEGLGRRRMTKCGARCQARDHAATHASLTGTSLACVRLTGMHLRGCYLHPDIQAT
jgi:hypothetical protein